MNADSQYSDRIRGQIDVPLLRTKHVVVVGVGTVGSPVAEHLAKDRVGSFLFIDGDTYEEVNRVRHVLPPTYVGMNKAEAMAHYLVSEKIPGLRVQALPRYVDSAMPNSELDELLDLADLIIAGTGEREVQRRLGERALALDIPAIFPALYRTGGGEVFIQTSPRNPCFFCWDGWRSRGEPVRGAEALGVEAMPVVQTAIELSLGILDPHSRYEELTLPDDNDPVRSMRQIFIMMPQAPLLALPWSKDRDCPSCAVGPSPLRQSETEAWQAASRTRAAPVPRTVESRPVSQVQPTRAKTSTPELWPIAAIAAVLFLIFALATHHSNASSASTSTTAPASANAPHEETIKTAANVGELASQRIAHLSFKCIEPVFCHEWPRGYHLPLFIGGMDDHLVAYLSAHGYTDLWTGNGPYFFNEAGGEVTTAKAIVPGPESEDVASGSGLKTESADSTTFAYVAAEGNSGLMPFDLGGGLASPEGIEAGAPVEVTWKLMNAAGEVVKELRFTTSVDECSAACEQAGKDPPQSYTPAEYMPPPLFPYKLLSP
jgi:ThiF family